MAASNHYTAQDITVLEGLEPVRKRPGMYIGGVDKKGLHHLVWEIVDNSIDEVMNGHATAVKVSISRDRRTCTVSDNGRGIPVDVHPKFKKSALEIIFTTLHSGGKFENKIYTHSGGLHGVGASVVNALSSTLVATVRREGNEFQQSYHRGEPAAPVKIVRSGIRGSGTEISFTPDAKVFGDIPFDSEWIRDRLEAKAFLHRGLRITFRDEKDGKTDEFCSEGGLVDYLAKEVSAGGRHPSHEGVFSANRAEEDTRTEVALQWTNSTETQILSYANGVYTSMGGAHETGLKNGIVRALREYLEEHDLTPKGVTISAEDIREGVVAILSVYLPDPQFQGQTKERLNNPRMTGLVEGWIRLALSQWLTENPTSAEAVVGRIVLAARARMASREAAGQVLRKTPVSHRLNLPGKLADCSSTNPAECELFIVEGDSAGGTAKQGRERRYQAILPIRGKVLNTEQASTQKVLENKELQNIALALGCGFGDRMDLSRLRYHKVCLLMDADSDGNHIATLLLTFFYRHMGELLRQGHVYIAQPPLYRIEIGREVYWVSSDRERARLLAKANGNRKIDIQRFKGLGEMNAPTLFETTLDPRRRTLLKVVIDDANSTEEIVAQLMGKDPSARFQFIMERAGQAEAEALDI